MQDDKRLNNKQKTGLNIYLLDQDTSNINRNSPVILLTVFIYLTLPAIVIGLIVRRVSRRIFNERLNASTDMLAGLLNRRAFDGERKLLADDLRRKRPRS